MQPNDAEPVIDAPLFRRVMGRFTTGVTVITARAEGVTRGMTANAFMSGSLQPPLCVVSIAKRAHMHEHLRMAGRFGVSILARDQEHLSAHFAGRPIPGLNVDFVEIGDIPTVPDATAWMTAVVTESHDCGDHTIFIGHLQAMGDRGHAALVFEGGHYVDTHQRRHLSLHDDPEFLRVW
jgi:flavin reductase (DIM6/NTAB) family NADH-FMN oxidoreductase RutF